MRSDSNKTPTTIFRIDVLILLTLVSLVLLAHHALAAEGSEPEQDSLVIASTEVLNEAVMNENRGSGGTVNTTIVESNQTITSTASGNSMFVAGNLSNGAVTVGDNFGGSGFGSYVMNTGNNSVINSGVSLSILMQ